MTTPDVRRVGQTTFTFPELPPAGEIAPELHARIMGERAAIVTAATAKSRTTCAAGGSTAMYFRHTCAAPAQCRVSRLRADQNSRWTGSHRPGARVTWPDGGVWLLGEVWDRAPGPAYWVLSHGGRCVRVPAASLEAAS